MFISVKNISNQFHPIYEHIEKAVETTQQKITNQTHKIHAFVLNTQHSINQTCHHATRCVSQKCQHTIAKVEGFICQNKETILFIGLSATTAYLHPFLFFPTAIIATAVRIEVARNLKKFFDDNWKDEKNPYKNPQYVRYKDCISTLDTVIGAIAAIDSIALATIYSTNFWAISILPILGGIAVGNAVAKFGMNKSGLLAPTINS